MSSQVLGQTNPANAAASANTSKVKRAAKESEFESKISELVYIAERLTDFFNVSHNAELRKTYSNVPTAAEYSALEKYFISELKKLPSEARNLTKGLRTSEYSGFMAPRLYNADMVDYIANANLGPIVDGTVISAVSRASKKTYTFQGLAPVPGSKLQEDLMGLQAGLTYKGKNVFLAQGTTLSRLFALDIFYSDPKNFKGSQLRFSPAMLNYLNNYLGNIQEPFPYNDLGAIARAAAIPDVKFSEKLEKDGTTSYTTPDDLLDQINAFLTTTVQTSEGNTRTTRSLIEQELQGVSGTSPTLSAINDLNGYVLLLAYDSNLSRKAYEYAQQTSPKSSTATGGRRTATGGQAQAGGVVRRR